MSRETDFETRMEADATLAAILTGGVYTSGAVGELGITRETTSAAFDSNGYLKPCALVRQCALDGAPACDCDRATSMATAVHPFRGPGSLVGQERRGAFSAGAGVQRSSDFKRGAGCKWA